MTDRLKGDHVIGFMNKKEIEMSVRRAIVRLQEILDEEYDLNKTEAVLEDVKSNLFELCEAIDESGNSDAAETADAITEALDMLDDLLGELDDDETDIFGAYEEIGEMIDSLSEAVE